jgi:hypothetical protein
MSSARQQADVLVELLRREHHCLAEFLVALAAFDRQRGWSALGHDSLFAFLVKDLRLSKGAAAYRRAAVELVQRVPEVLEHLRSGALCITTVFELAKVVTAENAAEVLPRFLGASRRDAKEVVAELAPVPAPERTIVTAVLAPAPALASLASGPGSAGRLADLVRANSEPTPHQGRDPRCGSLVQAPPTVVEPKTAELSRVHVTVPRRVLEKLAAAKDALSHSLPHASDADVLEVALDLIIDRHRKRRGIGAKPRKKVAGEGPETSAGTVPPPPPPRGRSRHAPADVWRAVWERDGGRCVWPLEGGGVCGSTRRIELDHVDGWALGADTTAERCRLLCDHHKDVHARALYGDAKMNAFRRPKGPPCSEPVAVYAAPAALRRAAASRRARRPAPRTRWAAATARPRARQAPKSPVGPARARSVPPASGARVWPAPNERAKSPL